MAAPFSIEPNLITYLKTIKDLFYTNDYGLPNLGVTIFQLAFNRTYKRDGGDEIIDENIAIRIKLATREQVEETTQDFIDAIIGSQIEDAEIRIAEALLLTKNPIQKESEEVYYQILGFRFVGNFK